MTQFSGHSQQNQLQTIAFPNISTGVYRFPKSKAAEIAIKAVKDFPNASQSLQTVLFVCFDKENFNLYNTLLK